MTPLTKLCEHVRRENAKAKQVGQLTKLRPIYNGIKIVLGWELCLENSQDEFSQFSGAGVRNQVTIANDETFRNNMISSLFFG